MTKWIIDKTKYSIGKGLSWYYEYRTCPYCNYTLGIEDYSFDDEMNVVVPSKCPKCDKEVRE